MEYHANPPDNEQPANYGQQKAEEQAAIERIHSEFGDAYTEDAESEPSDNKKIPVLIRVYHALWRRRKWRKMRHGGSGPNWAEKSTVILTLGIVVAAVIQLVIYSRQADIMQQSLSQNERTIILGQGQLAVAARNAKTAETTLEEVKSGGRDTHELSVQAKNQADRTLTQSIATNKLALQAQRSADIAETEQRSYIEAARGVFSNVKLSDLPSIVFNLPLKNVGKVPATKISYDFVVEVPKSSDGPSFDYTQLHTQGTAAPLYQGSDPYPVQVTLEDAGHPQMMNETLKRELETGDRYVVIFGIINYEDAFGIWWAHICVWQPFIKNLPAGKVAFFNASRCVAYNTEGGSHKLAAK